MRPSLSSIVSIFILSNIASSVVCETRGSKLPRAEMSENRPNANGGRILFSDVDGTLVHYPARLRGSGDGAGVHGAMMHLPPSSTGSRGVLSVETLRLCHRLRREGGVPVVLVSGMRATTLSGRLPYLPRADAYCCESGGRIFYPRTQEDEGGDDGGKEGGTVAVPHPYPGLADGKPFSLVEDMEWRARIEEVAGPFDSKPIGERDGKLWEFARELQKQGYKIDDRGYSAAFRVNRRHQPAELAETFDDFIARYSRKEGVPNDLDCSTNLGCVDFYPSMSGKKRCAEYLVDKILGAGRGDAEVSLETSGYCMCDDDNDIELALSCREAYLPSLTSDSMKDLVGSGKWPLFLTEDVENGIVETRATEVALERIFSRIAEDWGE
mmetsp:Transcript_13692/g.29809  ORF Transcript_13692/g.29809 Transcript_13692/m.29809 type:complete len:382 (-) Transcript_13692:165-1310(-)